MLGILRVLDEKLGAMEKIQKEFSEDTNSKK